jgi:hypothetical protein
MAKSERNPIRHSEITNNHGAQITVCVSGVRLRTVI